ncbi:MAG: ATP-binding protein [Thermodesulfobacteriota bacterium]
MSESYSVAPIWFTDVIGSGLMIVFSFLAVWYAVRLTRLQPSNVVWTYLLWLCCALAGFAVSRGVGHIAKRTLILVDLRDVWVSLRPYSGGINSVAFVIVASVTLFFRRVHRINSAILDDKHALEQASQEVLHLNRNLENLVRHRTDELSKSEKKYRRIFEGSMDMIFVLDPTGRFGEINPAGLGTLGYEREDLIGRTAFGDLFVSREGFRLFMEDLDGKGFVRDREFKLYTKRGDELHLLLSATARKTDAGEVERYEGIGKDITSRVQMERQLQRADRLASLGQISTGIAHEINNPLGIMLGYTQLLLRDHPPESEIHDDLKIIEKHARNCKTVVEDLLKFARSSPTRKGSVDVNQCLDEVVSLLAHQLELDNIVLKWDPDLTVPRVTADGEKLKQVFMNLLMNARQAITGKGTITLHTSSDVPNSMVHVTCSDTGSGIPYDAIDKIFDPFFTTKPVGEGTGLGLSVSYGIVAEHNGRIEVQSQVGLGSTFTVSLPAGAEKDQNP